MKDRAVPDTQISLLISSVAGALVAVDLSSVVRIGGQGESAGIRPTGGISPIVSIDIGRVIGVSDTQALSNKQRAITVTTEKKEWQIIVGPDATVISIDRSNVRDIPPFIQGISDLTAIRAVFLYEERFGFLFDLPRLRILAQKETFK